MQIFEMECCFSQLAINTIQSLFIVSSRLVHDRFSTKKCISILATSAHFCFAMLLD